MSESLCLGKLGNVTPTMTTDWSPPGSRLVPLQPRGADGWEALGRQKDESRAKDQTVGSSVASSQQVLSISSWFGFKWISQRLLNQGGLHSPCKL